MALVWTVCAFATLQALANVAEPDIPAPPDLQIPRGQPGERLQINFSAEAHAGPSRGTYWLTGNERIVADVQISVDVDRKEPVRVIGAAVIDGVQVPIRTAGRPSSRTVERMVVPGQIARFRMSIDAGRIAEGTHWAALIFWGAAGQRIPGWSFTVVKNGSPRQSPSGSSPFRVGATDDVAMRVYLRQPAKRLLFGRAEPIAPASEGTAAFDVHLAESASPGDRTRVHTLLAFLDGAQVPFAPGTAAPTVALAPGSAGDALLTVRDLPARRGHLLLLFLVTQQRPSGEGVPGTESDWQVVPPRQVGGLIW